MEETLGKRIMQCRKQLHLTQDQLADKLGVTAQAVSKWENNQSCPDIATLPKLASIFGITTDALLGVNAQSLTHTAEVITEESGSDDLHIKNSEWEIRYNCNRVALAFWVLSVGVQLLLTKLLSMDVSFWKILWPSALLAFGLFNNASKFNPFRIICILVGGYFALDNFNAIPFQISGGLVLPTVIVLIGVSLLFDALKKPKQSSFHFQRKANHDKKFYTSGETFEYHACLAEDEQLVELSRLSHGDIQISFGEYTIDLTGVKELAENCRLDIQGTCCELTLHIPRCYAVHHCASTTGAAFTVEGHPDDTTKGVIHIDAHIAFSEVIIQYA